MDLLLASTSSVIPFLLYNAEVFVGINSKVMKMLDKVSLRYLRMVLAVGSGCPIPIMFTETNTLLMSNRIWLRKLLFLRHVLTLPVGTLARDIADKQRQHNLGLFRECEPLLRDMGIQNIEDHSKYIWKKITKNFIFKKNRNDLIIMIEKKKYSKIDIEAIRNQPIQISEYFKTLSVDDSRLKFKLMSRMTPSVASNFSSSKKFRDRGLLCVGCAPPSPPHTTPGAVTDSGPQPQPANQETGSRDTENLIKMCLAYSDLRKFKSLDDAGDKEIVDFFRSVIERRAHQENS